MATAAAGFTALHPLPTRVDDPRRASPPFEGDRDGFVVGEGAVMLVLESAEHARRCGQRVYSESAGTATSSDGCHPVAPSPDGEGAARATWGALSDASACSSAAVHINADATSKPVGTVRKQWPFVLSWAVGMLPLPGRSHDWPPARCVQRVEA